MMYNRYIRNDHGTYTRIIEDDAPSAAASPPAVESVPRRESTSGNPQPDPPPEQTTNPQPGKHSPPRSGNMPPPGRSANSPSHSGPPPQSNTPPQSGEHPPPRHDSTEQHGPNSFHHNPFRNLFDAFQPEHMENGDLLLLALIFLLSRENADEEVLAALGLLLIL